MDKFKEFLGSINSEWKTGLSIALAIIFIFSLGNIAGSLTNINATPASSLEESTPVAETVAPTTAAPTTVAPTTAAPTAAPTTAAPTAADTQNTEAPTSSDTAATTVADTQTATPSTGTPSTTEEIVALFNESANKVKTTAKKATRNYQDTQITSLEVPSALQSIADTAIDKFVKPNMTPEVYEGELIAEKYPVSGTDFASKLKPEYLESITCTDNGTEYVIDIALKDQQNPVYRSGEGVGSIFWTMNPQSISDNLPTGEVEKCELYYYDCTATAKIDKATGNMTYSRFIYNFDMDMSIKLVVSLDAKASLTIDEEYVMEY